jgi:hypothetical protein
LKVISISCGTLLEHPGVVADDALWIVTDVAKDPRTEHRVEGEDEPDAGQASSAEGQHDGVHDVGVRMTVGRLGPGHE